MDNSSHTTHAIPDQSDIPPLHYAYASLPIEINVQNIVVNFEQAFVATFATSKKAHFNTVYPEASRIVDG
eukprot:gene34634-41939_t